MFGVSVFCLGSIITSYIFKLLSNIKFITEIAKRGYVLNYENVDSITCVGYVADYIPLPENIILSIPVLNMIYMLTTLDSMVNDFDSFIEVFINQGAITKLSEQDTNEFLKKPTFSNAIYFANKIDNEKKVKGALQTIKNTEDKLQSIEITLFENEESSYIYFYYENGELYYDGIEGPLERYDDELLMKILDDILNNNFIFNYDPEKFEKSERKQCLINFRDSLLLLKEQKEEKSQVKVRKK